MSTEDKESNNRWSILVTPPPESPSAAPPSVSLDELIQLYNTLLKELSDYDQLLQSEKAKAASAIVDAYCVIADDHCRSADAHQYLEDLLQALRWCKETLDNSESASISDEIIKKINEIRQKVDAITAGAASLAPPSKVSFFPKPPQVHSKEPLADSSQEEKLQPGVKGAFPGG